MRSVDLSYLGDNLLAVQLRSGGPSFAVRNPAALESVELDEVVQLKAGREQVERAHALLAQLMPAAPIDDIRAMPYVQIFKLLLALGEATRVVMAAAADDAYPNGKAGTVRPSPIPATSGDTSSGGSLNPPDAAYGPS
jgi:hypothetical protein